MFFGCKHAEAEHSLLHKLTCFFKYHIVLNLDAFLCGKILARNCRNITAKGAHIPGLEV